MSEDWGGYEMPRWENQPVIQRETYRESEQSIYVISSTEGISKIGISVLPKKRLLALQWANPLHKLELEWSFEEKWSKITRAEKLAHRILRPKQLKGEWFTVLAAEAIDAAKLALGEVGIPI
jgi:hypothetical protein